jgi:hypothetical protein
LFGDPLLRAGFEEIERETSAVEHFVVEGANVKLGTQFFSSSLTEVQELGLAYLVAASLCGRPRNVPINLRLDRWLIGCAGFSHKLNGLIASPSLRVNSRIDHQAHSAPKFRRKATLVRNGILV